MKASLKKWVFILAAILAVSLNASPAFCTMANCPMMQAKAVHACCENSSQASVKKIIPDCCKKADTNLKAVSLAPENETMTVVFAPFVEYLSSVASAQAQPAFHASPPSLSVLATTSVLRI